MFTIGQANRMTTSINSTPGGRNNLSTVSNLTATGIISPVSPCAPIADCHTNSGSMNNLYIICAGQTLNFFDDSYNGPITSRAWTTNSTGTMSAPSGTLNNISFPIAGIYTVNLTVGNSVGSSSVVKSVTVVPSVANYTTTYQESFEAGPSLPANWTIINQTGGTTWQRNTAAAATGTASYYLQNGVNPNNAIDILETPSYDFLNNTGATFTFKYAYAQKTSTWADVFKVQASKDCGGSWSDIYVPSASFLASGSGGVTSAPFTPTSTSQWKTYTLTSHPAFNTFKSQPNVRIRFYFKEDATTGFGNNFFLDDINFNAPLGVNELTRSVEFVLYPNPTEGSASIDFTLSDKADIRFCVMDVTGRLVEAERSYSDLSPGHHSYKINESGKLRSGIYFVNLELNGQKMSRKLIVE
jgi:PKD repeat protein